MTVLVLGASGLLGSNVAATAKQRTGHVVGTYHTNHPDLGIECHHCNLGTDGAAATLVDEHDPELVVNCAAITDVDECERDPETAREINSDAPGRIAELCHKRNISFVHISTDYVFDGERRRPYPESHAPNPIQTYGRTKRAGERAVMESNPPYRFGQEISSRLSATGNIVEGTRKDVDRTAPRPGYTCLDIDKVETILGRPQPTLEEDLDKLAAF
jgi:dTDP-4-dehydrorhamnose reductase